MRAVWTEDPVTFQAKYIPAIVEEMRMRPLPPPIPIWIGGNSDAAIARAIRLGDGWHGTRTPPDAAPAVVARLRAARPDPAFTISLRASWDGEDVAAFRTRLQAYAQAGIQHLVLEPTARELDDWLAAVERIARAGEGLAA
jgi:alkanesulfonate monooxygenase SsuD/methylene tetrahydromethanopterin reductase-like flavin-dependent oxidoreductase (luciferase family)